MSSPDATDRGPTGPHGPGQSGPSPARVVIIRPWTGGHTGGCCSGGVGSDPVALDRPVRTPAGHDPAVHRLGECYRLLHEELPEVDVQIVSANNTAYLLPHVYRRVRAGAGGRPATGRLAAARAAVQATRAGAVLVDGHQVALLPDDEPRQVLDAVRAALGPTPPVG